MLGLCLSRIWTYVFMALAAHLLADGTSTSDLAPSHLTYPLFFGVGALVVLGVAVLAAWFGRQPARAQGHPSRPSRSRILAIAPTFCGLLASLSLVAAIQLPSMPPLLAMTLALGGVELGLLRLSWGLLHCRLDERRLGLCTALSFLIAVCVGAILRALPAIVGPWLLFLLALAAGVCLTRAAAEPGNTPAEKRAPTTQGSIDTAEPASAAPFWPLAIGMFVFVTASALLTSLMEPQLTPDWLATWRTVLVDAVVALAFTLVFAAAPSVDTARAYRIALPLMAAGYALFPLVPGEHRFIGALVAAVGYGLFDLLSWIVMVGHARQHPQHAARTLCLGIGMTLLGRAVGTLGGELLAGYQGAGSVSLSSISLIMLFALVIVCLTILPGLTGRRVSTPNTPTPTTLPDPVQPLSAGCQRLADANGLTARELDVLTWLAKGRNAASISAELGIARGTAQTHIKHIYAKTGLHNQQELMGVVESLGARNEPSTP